MEGANDPIIHPNTMTYSIIIDLYAKVGHAQKALQLLDRMEHMSNEGIQSVRPNGITYNTCLNAYAKSNEENAPQIAESILSRMELMFERGDKHIQPSLISYSTVMNAYAKRGYPHKVESILNVMNERYAKGEIREQPDIVMFNTAIAAWSKSNDPQAPLRAEKLLKAVMDHKKLKPKTITFNSVLMVWARNDIGGAVAISRAEAILTQMEDQFKQTADIDLRPDARTYTTIIDALAKSKRPGAARKAEAILRRMKKAYEDGNIAARPSKFTYSGLIYAWAKSGESSAPQRAESLLRDTQRLADEGMYHLKPFAQTYDAVIDTYARSNAQGNVDNAERIFNEMLQRHLSGESDMEPTVRSFNKLLLAYAKAYEKSMIYRAEACVGKWNKLRRDQVIRAKPNAITFSTLIKIWGTSKKGQAGAKGAEKVLCYMKERYNKGDAEMKPDIIAYNSVLNAWSNCKGKGVLDRMVSLFQDILAQYNMGDTTMKPDRITYKSFIRSLASNNENVEEVAEKATILLQNIEHISQDNCSIVQTDIESCEIVIGLLSRSRNSLKGENIKRIISFMEK